DRNTTDTISGVLGATPAPITAATETGNTVTITAGGAYSVGQQILISNVAPAGFNGTFTITAVGSGTFSYFDATAGLVSTSVANSTAGAITSNLNVNGKGTLVLGGANLFTGTVNMTEGVTNIQNQSALGVNLNAATVVAGAQLQLQGTFPNIAKNIILNGNGIQVGGAAPDGTGALRLLDPGA